MAAKIVDKHTILEALQQIPAERWQEVLRFIRSLQAAGELPSADRPVSSGADLAGSDLIGIWAQRSDIKDSREFARQLRDRAEHRRGTSDAAGH